MTEEEARQILKDDVNYFGVMLVHMGIVDGMVSGAIHSTAATVRPALQIIKTRPNVKRTSGAFLSWFVGLNATCSGTVPLTSIQMLKD